MLIKGRAAEGFSRRPDPDVWAVLVFGEDESLTAHMAQTVIAGWGAGHGMDVTVLDDEAVRKQPALLFDALEAVSLLGDARAVRVRTSGDKIAGLLIEAIKSGETSPGYFAAKLVIEAGMLPARSKLRSAAESARRTVCMQLFAEEEADIAARVKSALLVEGAIIDDAALGAFVGDLPGHRSLASSEIEKLALYARGLGRAVSVEDVRSLTATDLKQAVSGALLAALDGRPGEAQSALDRLAENGTSGISILRSLQLEVVRMLTAHEKIVGGDPAPGRSLRPPVWPTDWPAYKARLGKWPARRLMRVIERIHDAERQIKTAGATGDPLIRLLINDLARAALAAR